MELLKKYYRTICDAIDSGDPKTLRQIFTDNSELLAAKSPRGTWLHIACLRGSLPCVKLLVEEYKADINSTLKEYGSISPLCNAARYGFSDVVSYLLDKGATMTTNTSLASTANPLFSATMGHHLDVVKVLVERGIDTTVKYKNDVDAIEFARQRQASDIVEYLAEIQI